MSLIDVPQHPPVEWLEPPTDWSGGSVKIVTSGPDAGRACGLVQPPPGSARYLGPGKFHAAPIPPSYPDETFRDFHCGAWDFVDGDAMRSVPVGSIALGGGHSNKVMAANVLDARDYLQRRGKHDAESELALYGTVTRLTEGPHAGGLLFCGAAYPHLTLDDARVFNTTTLSGENWPHPDHNGQVQFIGPARVQRTSFAYDLPMAADADGIEGGPIIVCFINDDGERVCTDCDTGEMAEPMVAEVGDDEFGEVRRSVEELVGRTDAIEAAVAELELATTSGDEVTVVAQLSALLERMTRLEVDAEAKAKMQGNAVGEGATGEDKAGSTSAAVAAT